jgi:hypothetical protein
MSTLNVEDIARIKLADDEVLFVKLSEGSPARHAAASQILTQIFGEGRVIVSGPGTEVFAIKDPRRPAKVQNGTA